MYIFLLGRPGCGKSAIYRMVVEKLKEKGVGKEYPRVDDFPKLWAIFQNDEKTGQWKRCRKTPDGGYKVTDDTVWDEILRQVNDDLLKFSSEEVIFVEFSRSDYLPALKNFDDKVIKNSVIVYIDCDFETCWERNVDRHKKALAAGTDDHLVSREEMEKTYLYDDRDKLIEAGKQNIYKVIVIKNDKNGYEHLVKPIEDLVNMILKK
jgi:adenylate kinase family enzyme